MSSLEAENYHLKWDSHMSFLNTSVATLYKNVKFADVMLFSSSPEAFGAVGDCDDTFNYGGGVPAHKFILSSCSHFFASILESTPSAPNGIMYIVLPSDLSRQAIQILVQYMYSGEATVSNSIINEVLRGGEMLKIRGLCRTSNSNTSMSTTSATTTTTTATSSVATTIINNGGTISNHSIVNPQANGSTKIFPRRPSKNHKVPTNCTRIVETDYRGLGASVVPKESPVVVRSPKLSQSQPSLGLLTVAVGNHTTSGITINKDVAIDPETKNFQSYLKQPRNCAIADCRGCYTERPLSERSFDLSNARRQSEEVVCMSKDIPPVDPLLVPSKDDEHLMESIKQRPSYLRQTTIKHAASNIEPSKAIIKEEPDEWQIDNDIHQCVGGSNSIIGNNTVQTIKKVPTTAVSGTNTITTIVKQEYRDSEDDARSSPLIDRDDNVPFSEVKCEQCKETFVDFNLWLRHIQSHTEALINLPSDLPAPSTSTTIQTSSNGHSLRQKTSDEQAVALLQCDICRTIFTTPADWVRHTQFEHTESELAVWNNSHELKPKLKRNTSTESTTSTHRSQGKLNVTYLNYRDRSCDVCHKKFSSYTTMVMHRRTHNRSTSVEISND